MERDLASSWSGSGRMAAQAAALAKAKEKIAELQNLQTSGKK